MSGHYFLRTLGQPELFAPDGQPIRIRVRKHLALLVYFAVSPGVHHRRDQLAQLLWPSAGLIRGRHSLATALSVLRAHFGHTALKGGRDTIRFTVQDLLLDLDLLAQGHVLGTEVNPPLQIDGFLSCFDLQDAEEYLRWRDRQHATLLPQIVSALEQQIDLCRRTARTKDLEQLADRLIALDPLSESGIRAKMEARAFSGDRITALRIFDEWKGQLETELQAAPSQLVEGIAIRLRRRGWERVTTADIASVPTDQWKDTPFIARGLQYRVLYEAFERTRSGNPTHVLIRGDSGIGKTTLAHRVVTAASLEGASCTRVQCYELDREIPYSALAALIAGLLGHPGATGVAPDALAELSRILPEVRHRFPSIPQPQDSQGETARVRLAEAFQQLVHAVADEHTVILTIDDMHLADDASLAVVHLLMRWIRSEPVMILLTVRPAELGHSPAASRVLDSGPSLGVSVLELQPLTDAESDELIGCLVPDPCKRPAGAHRRALVDASKGYPMVIEFLVRDWLDNGDSAIALSMQAMTADLRVGNATPYEWIFERVAQRLDSTTRSVLNFATILGHRLNDIAMYELVDLGVGQTMAGLTRLATLRVLRDNGQGLEFANELLRAYAYRAVPSSVRRMLHSKIADRLLVLPADHQKGLEIAWHCIRAGREAEALPHLFAGARQALRRGAPHEAERGISSGMGAIGQDKSDAARLLWAEALQEQGRWAQSLTVLDAMSSNVSDEVKEAATLLQFAASHALGWTGPEADTAAVQHLIAIAVTTQRPNVRAKAVGAAATICERLRVPATSCWALSQVKTISLQEGDDEDRLAMCVAVAQLAYHTGETMLSKRYLEAAVPLLRRSGIVNSAAGKVYGGLSAHEVHAGNYVQALEYNSQAIEIARRAGDDIRCSVALAARAFQCGRLGYRHDQLAAADEAITGLGTGFRGFPQLQAHYWKAFGLALEGKNDQALETVAQQDSRLTDPCSAWIRVCWKLYKADILLLCGRERMAREAAQSAIADYGSEDPPLHLEGIFTRWRAIVAQTEREQRQALDMTERQGSSLEAISAFDRAEVLASKAYLCQRLSYRGNGEIVGQLRDILGRLPHPAGEQLEQLGILRLQP